MRVLPFAFTIFLSAFLLFQVQPLISRYILPWFGGSPGVWSVAILFFQALLLAGYAYAHLSIARLAPRGQLIVHLGLLVLCLFLLPIAPSEGFKPEGGESPTLRILVLLLATVGAPYFVLSATGPLLQAWFSRAEPGRSPYALYALSNVGSLIGLVSYPFVVESLWGRYEQAVNWSWLFVVFVVVCGVTAVVTYVSGKRSAASAVPVAGLVPMVGGLEVEGERRGGHPLLWVAFPAAGSLLLLAFTAQICMDVASVPFLWMVPLSLYLLSFIISFAGERWYSRPLFLVLMIGAIGAVVYALIWGEQLLVRSSLALYSCALFVLCMVCHGETFRLRPPPARLTQYYLCISLGGVMGGVAVALVAPLVFTRHAELEFILVGVAVLVLIVLWRDPRSCLSGGRPRWAWVLAVLVVLGGIGGLGWRAHKSGERTLYATRNFYGVFRVDEWPILDGRATMRKLISGRVNHGLQYIDPDYRNIPTTYYSQHSGVGLTIEAMKYRPIIKVGVVGLGTGTLASYARLVDHYRFYEINPVVEGLAREFFYFLEECKGKVDVVIGDARLALEREDDQGYDLLVLDAFSSDAVPVHLLTFEAFEEYARHLKPDGVICVHISNRHLDLSPVCSRAAGHLGFWSLTWCSGVNPYTGSSLAEWVVMTHDEVFKGRFEAQARGLRRAEEEAGRLDRYRPYFGNSRSVPAMPESFRAWTDDYSNLFSILR
jgi:SAM-dependent methyltransferase